jgi:hypothetical protein
LILDFHRGININFWFWGSCTVCEVNFLMTFREPLWVPKSRREIHLSHRARTPKPKIKKDVSENRICTRFQPRLVVPPTKNSRYQSKVPQESWFGNQGVFTLFTSAARSDTAFTGPKSIMKSSLIQVYFLLFRFVNRTSDVNSRNSHVAWNVQTTSKKTNPRRRSFKS